MIHAFSLGLICAGIWLLLSGHYNPLLLGLGAMSCLFVVFIARRMDVVDREGQPVHLHRQILSYWAWLLVQVVKSNLNVIRCILHPDLPIAPRVIRVPNIPRTDLGRVILANSITLTPGTVTLRVDGDTLLVHALTETGARELLRGEMARRVRQVEGED